MRITKATLGATLLAVAIAMATPAGAQQITTLVPFNANWRYLQPSINPGAGWRSNTFDDATWPQGPGLLQGGEVTAYPAPFGTVIAAPGSVRITDYFRHSFVYNGPTNGIALYASNFVDDGAVIYLNGAEAGRIRMNPNPTWATLATGGPTMEGQIDAVQINQALLRPGQDNVLAVEVHQSAAGSADVVWGTHVVVHESTQLTITRQPASQIVAAPAGVTFSVAVTGTPIFYQWQKNGANIAGATNSSLSVAPTTAGSAGSFRVVVSNSVSRVVSSDAVLTMLPDTTGPVMLSALLLDFGPTNTIEVTFDEQVLGTSVTTNSLRVIRAGTFGAAATSAIVTNVASSGRAVRLRLGGPNWNSHSNFYIVANWITDSSSNLIAPNSVIAMSTGITTNLALMNDEWTYYDWLTDASTIPSTFPMIFTNYGASAWFRNSFVEDPWIWIPVTGVMYYWPTVIPVPVLNLCDGDGLGTKFEFHSEFPLYLRRKVHIPADFGTSARVTLRHIVDDGFVLYLNGVEIYRYNMRGAIGAPLDYLETKAMAVLVPSCVTSSEIIVTNFQAGVNLLAAAVYQTAIDQQWDMVFGLEMSALFSRTPSLLLTNGPNAHLQLHLARQGNNGVITWPNSGPNIYYGYLLEETTALDLRTASPAWRAISNGTNGAVVRLQPGVSQFYRLRRGPNSPTLP